ncbi:hypothetical protein [Sorangium sp. So ce1389]|uniref:hypothetical protein n=1 Tax=Sorangium sp. So ce1389 TaxID=3133336 RepID=UPI003F61F9C3
MPDIRAAIFDAYGTLLDVHAPVLAQSERIGLACGYRAFRVNRAGDPDEYGLRGRAPELDDLAKLPALL